jgi:hypothetical protein
MRKLLCLAGLLAALFVFQGRAAAQFQQWFVVTPQPIAVPTDGTFVRVLLQCNGGCDLSPDGIPSLSEWNQGCAGPPFNPSSCPTYPFTYGPGLGNFPQDCMSFLGVRIGGNTAQCVVQVAYIGPKPCTTQNASFTLFNQLQFSSASFAINLVATAPPPVSVAVAPSNPAIGVGQQQQFTATATCFNGTTFDVTADVSGFGGWSSSNTSVATMNSNLATALAPGSTTITALWRGTVSGTTQLSVFEFKSGSWNFNVTSGDSAAQLAASGDTEFSAYLLVDSNGILSNIQDATLSTSATQYFGGEDGIIVNGSVSSTGTVNTIFNVTNGNGSTSQFNFTGTVSTAANATTIVGTYTATASDVANCQQTYCISQYVASGGSFTATWFPPLFTSGGTNVYAGDFDAPLNLNSGVVGPGPDNVPATLTFTGENQGNATGTITLPNGMMNPSGAACFTNFPDASSLHFDPTTLGPDPTGIDSGNWQTGYQQQFWATDNSPTPVHVLVYGYSMGDCNGTEVPSCATNSADIPDALGETFPAAAGAYFPLSGSAPQVLFNGGRWNGTNSEIYLNYAITGGNCDGMGGGDQPFMKVTRKDKHGKPRPKKPGHGHKDRWHGNRNFDGRPGYGNGSREQDRGQKENVHPTEVDLLRNSGGNDPGAR